LRVLRGPERIIGLAFDPAGVRLAAAADDDTVWLWDLEGPPDAQPLALHRKGMMQVGELTFDASGEWLASNDIGRGTTLWPLARAYPYVLVGHRSRVWCVAFSPDGRWLASGAGDTVRMWPLGPSVAQSGRVLFEGHGATTVAFDPGGRQLLATGGEGGEVWLIPLDGREPRLLPGFTSYVWSAALSPDGRLAAAGGGHRSNERVIRIWDLETGAVQVLGPVDGPASGFMSLQFTADGLCIISGAWDGVRLWSLDDGSSQYLGPGGPIVALSPDGRTLYTAEFHYDRNFEDRLWVYDLESGDSRLLPAHRTASSVALDPTGTLVVTGGQDGAVRVGPVTGEEPHLLLAPEGAYVPVAVSPDGDWIASGHTDGTIRLWSMPEGRPFHDLPHGELLARLRALTNLRAVLDEKSETGYEVVPGAFPGWETVPRW
jgi:WD40 repeat protein